MVPTADNIGFWIAVLVVMLPLTIIAAYIDGAHRRVPNWTTFGLLFTGLIAHAVFFGWNYEGMGVMWSLIGWFTGLIPLFAVWWIHGMGAGDVKLIAGWGAWIGGPLVLTTYAIGLLLGGVMAVLMIVITGKHREFAATFAVLSEKFTSQEKLTGEFASARVLATISQIPLLPYGVPLTLGLIFVLSCHLFGPPEARGWYEQVFEGFWPIR